MKECIVLCATMGDTTGATMDDGRTRRCGVLFLSRRGGRWGGHAFSTQLLLSWRFGLCPYIAKQQCKQAVDGNLVAFSEPWHKCNNCKQQFQGQLAIDLISACVSFTEATYGHPSCSKWDKLKVLESLRLKIDASNKLPHTDVEELVDTFMSIIDQTKKKYKMSRWIHMPKTST